MIPLTGGLAAVLLSSREFPPQSRRLCLVLEPPQLSEGSLCAFCLPKRSGFISVAVLKHSNWKQLRRGKGLFSLQFRGAAHPSSWEVKAGTESAGHITPRVKSRKKRTHPYLPFAVLLVLSELLYPTVLDRLLREWRHPRRVFPNHQQSGQFLTDIHTHRPDLPISSIKPLKFSAKFRFGQIDT